MILQGKYSQCPDCIDEKRETQSVNEQTPGPPAVKWQIQALKSGSRIHVFHPHTIPCAVTFSTYMCFHHQGRSISAKQVAPTYNTKIKCHLLCETTFLHIQDRFICSFSEHLSIVVIPHPFIQSVRFYQVPQCSMLDAVATIVSKEQAYPALTLFTFEKRKINQKIDKQRQLYTYSYL